MSLRVALYAEGVGETLGEIRARPKPRDRLTDEHLGPAHWLVRRLISHIRPRLPEPAIQFEEPLRVGVRVARGSDLLHRPTIRQLLTWISGTPPELAIVLVDCDGVPARHSDLTDMLRGLPGSVTRVVGVAVEEFESWLIGDSGALAKVLPGATPPPEIERLERREAKLRLKQWSAAQGEKAHPGIRLSLARLCDLDTLGRRCPSFARFVTDLSAALPQ